MSRQLNIFQLLFLLAVITVLALAVVAQGAGVVKLGYIVRRLEQEKRLLAEGNRQLLCEISRLGSPERIANEVEEQRLGLVEPSALDRADLVIY